MAQSFSPQPDGQQALIGTLQSLSAREQISVLVVTSRSLSGHDKAIIFRSAGFSLFKDRFLPILLHVFLKRILAGAAWWFLCVLAAVVGLFALALVDHINTRADLPVIIALVGFLGGFLCFSFFSFCRDIIQLFRRTRSRSELQQLQNTLNAYNDPARVAILRVLGGSISKNMPGESLVASLLTSLLVLGVVIVMAVLLIGITFLLPTLGQFPWILFVGGCALLLGFFAPRTIEHFLEARRIG